LATSLIGLLRHSMISAKEISLLQIKFLFILVV
jgi:hypothetical protein